MTHTGEIVTVITENNSFRLVIDCETITVGARTSREIGRCKAYAMSDRLVAVLSMC
jgi:hypothetical protein